MKKNLKIITAILASSLLSIALSIVVAKTFQPKPEPKLIAGQGLTPNLMIYVTSSATTSDLAFNYLGSGAATSTLGFFAGNSGIAGTKNAWIPIKTSASVDYNIMAKASSSAAILCWANEFSFDKEVWYGEDSRTVGTNNLGISHGATTTSQCFGFDGTSTTTKNVTITPTASPYLRMKVWVAGAAAAIRVEAILNEIVR